MKIQNIHIQSLAIPFRVSVTHASATRSVTQTVVVVAESETCVGYGEGCPREYVTGESIGSAMDFFDSYRDAFLGLETVADIALWARENREVVDLNPATWCAVELALLDLIGKENGCSVEALLTLPEVEGPFRYTAVLGAGDYGIFAGQFGQYIEAGFSDFKMKVSGDVEEDSRKVALFRGHDVRMRLDANNLWQTADEAVSYIEKLDGSFFALEEPVDAGDFSVLGEISERLGLKIILDESFVRVDQFALLEQSPENWIINLRISKMGGIIRSLKIAEEAKRREISLIIGAQVGETSILTRSALGVATSYREIVLGQEGAFGTHLLERDIVARSLIFGDGGVLEMDEFGLEGSGGFGLKVDLSCV